MKARPRPLLRYLLPRGAPEQSGHLGGCRDRLRDVMSNPSERGMIAFGWRCFIFYLGYNARLGDPHVQPLCKRKHREEDGGCDSNRDQFLQVSPEGVGVRHLRAASISTSIYIGKRRGTYENVLFVLFDTHALLDRDSRSADGIEVRLVHGMLDRLDGEGDSDIDVPTNHHELLIFTFTFAHSHAVIDSPRTLRQRDNHLGLIHHNARQSRHKRHPQHLILPLAPQPPLQPHIPANNKLIHPPPKYGIPRPQLQDRRPAPCRMGRTEIGRGDVPDDVVVVRRV